MNYYDEIIHEIKDLINNENYEEALGKLKAELTMPYIPSEAEKELKALYRDVTSFLNSNKKSQTVIPDDMEMEECLFSTNLEVEMGVIQILRKLKLDDYLDLIKKYLENPIYDEVSSLLIYLLIEAGIDEEFKAIRDGLEVTFVPSSCLLPEEGEGYEMGMDFLDKVVTKNPSMLNMAKDMLHLKMLNNLPFVYEEDEIEFVCKLIIVEVFKAMELDDELKTICQENNWNLEDLEIFC